MKGRLPKITYLVDENGREYGVMLTLEAWNRVKDSVLKTLNAAKEAEKPEPMKDWELLNEYWDFKYPPTAELHCDHCGTESPDWVKDSPRQFKLKAANIGGLASFVCLKCKSRVVKRHFKDCIKYECTPAEALG